jgi:hypothetical protein
MSSKAFTLKTFTFLHQVNHNPELPSSDLAVCLELSCYFNEDDQDGRAWPGCKTIGDAIGLSETTVIRSVRRLEKHGHIRVIWGTQGRGHPNQYWMIVKPAPAQVLEPEKPAPVQGRKPASVTRKPAPVQENLLKNHIGDQEVPNMCESSDRQEPIGSLAGGDPPPLRAAPSEEQELPLDRVVEESKEPRPVEGEIIPPGAPRSLSI